MTPLGTNWVVTTIVGVPGVYASRDGTNRMATLDEPLGVVVDHADNLYVSELGGDVRKITRDGTNWVVTTLGMPQRFGYLLEPGSLVVDDTTGNVFVADTYNNCLAMAQPEFYLQTAVLGGRLKLSWPSEAASYFLESTTNPTDPSSWAPTPWLPCLTNGAYSLTVEVLEPSIFYRLHKR